MYRTKTVVIVDDEPLCIKRLEDDLNRLDDFEVVGISTSAFKAVGLVVEKSPDILFLDVMMPVADGFEVFEEIKKVHDKNMLVVFYSAFDKFIIDALRSAAFDFLIKPYQPEELECVVGRLRERIENASTSTLTSADGMPYTACGTPELDALHGTAAKRIAIQTISGLMLLRHEEVFAFRFSDQLRLWEMTAANGATYRLRKQTNAKTLLASSDSFVQVRQECIVNIDFLLGIENTTLRCIFRPPFDTEEIIVSRRYYKDVKDKLEIL